MKQSQEFAFGRTLPGEMICCIIVGMNTSLSAYLKNLIRVWYHKEGN